MARETNDFQNVFEDLLKCLEKGEHPRDDCFLEQRFQMTLLIAAFRVGFGSLNDVTISFALIE